jgi:hypothetical protein
MYYRVETDKSLEQASGDLAESVKNNAFVVLHIHNLGGTLRSKGIVTGANYHREEIL